MGCCQTQSLVIAPGSARSSNNKSAIDKQAQPLAQNSDFRQNGDGNGPGSPKKKLTKADMKRNKRTLTLTKRNIKMFGYDYSVFKMQTKTLLRLIMSDLMANLYEKSQNELQITGTIVSYLTFIELLRLSYSCKRIYIVMGDLRVLQRFQMAANRSQQRRGSQQSLASHAASPQSRNHNQIGGFSEEICGALSSGKDKAGIKGDRDLLSNLNQLSYVIRHYENEDMADDLLLIGGSPVDGETDRPAGVAVLATNPFMVAQKLKTQVPRALSPRQIDLTQTGRTKIRRGKQIQQHGQKPATRQAEMYNNRVSLNLPSLVMVAPSSPTIRSLVSSQERSRLQQRESDAPGNARWAESEFFAAYFLKGAERQNLTFEVTLQSQSQFSHVTANFNSKEDSLMQPRPGSLEAVTEKNSTNNILRGSFAGVAESNAQVGTQKKSALTSATRLAMKCFPEQQKSQFGQNQPTGDTRRSHTFNILDKPGISASKMSDNRDSIMRQNPLAASVEAIEPALGMFSPFQKLNYATRGPKKTSINRQLNRSASQKAANQEARESRF